MKYAIVAVLAIPIGVGAMLGRCSTPPPTLLSDELHCADITIHRALHEVLPDVTIALATLPESEWRQEMTRLALILGEPAVICAVVTLVSDFSAYYGTDAGAPPSVAYANDSKKLAAERGRAYLTEKSP